VRPEASAEDLAAFLRPYFPGASFDRLHRECAPRLLSLADRAFVGGVHPLELWLVSYLQERPGASFGDVVAASFEERRQAYEWLFRTGAKQGQDIRIRWMLEEDAFGRIHRAWARLGYPFDTLVPSLATALGSSGDRPAALAELVGILLNEGMRKPAVRIEGLELAKGTPFETVLHASRRRSERVLAPEIARVVLSALVDVVEQGTAVRAKGSVLAHDGTPVTLGGKTGTGDNRLSIQGPALNRTATFVFFLQDRYFGVLTAFVLGEDAESYRFTSSLPVQLFVDLVPNLGLDLAPAD
jgi:hypothetical protein